MAIYFKYGKIKGDSTEKNHKGSDGWQVAHSCSFNVSRHINTPTGNTQDRTAQHANVSDIMLTKTQNTVSSEFFKEATAGKGCDCVIEYVQDGAEHGQPFMKLTLKNAMISHWSSGSSGDRPSESLSISFTEVEVGTTEYNAKGDVVTSTKGSFNISEVKTA